jgi:hypothetical protein
MPAMIADGGGGFSKDGNDSKKCMGLVDRTPPQS